MEWAQVFTLVLAMGAATFVFCMIVRKDINEMNDRYQKAIECHCEDMRNLDAKWDRLFEIFFISNKKKA